MPSSTTPHNLIGAFSDATVTPTATRTYPLDFIADQVGGALSNDDAFLDIIGKRIVTEAFLQSVARAVAATGSNPFDSIYIADLKPDSLRRTSIEEIEKNHGIVDVSDSVRFDDDLD